MMKMIALCAGLFLANSAVAQTNIALGGLTVDTTAAIEVIADSLSVDQDTGIAIFDGNVMIGQGDLRITAGRVQVVYGTDTSQIARLVATNGVTFVTATEAAEDRGTASSTTARPPRPKTRLGVCAAGRG